MVAYTLLTLPPIHIGSVTSILDTQFSKGEDPNTKRLKFTSLSTLGLEEKLGIVSPALALDDERPQPSRWRSQSGALFRWSPSARICAHEISLPSSRHLFGPIGPSTPTVFYTSLFSFHIFSFFLKECK